MKPKNPTNPRKSEKKNQMCLSDVVSFGELTGHGHVRCRNRLEGEALGTLKVLLCHLALNRTAFRPDFFLSRSIV